jgi:diguanylate cyclase (GGDEF)-like protein/PAS domain S-box-containing protein
VKFSLKTKATALVTAVVFGVFGTMGYVRHERLATELLQVQSQQQAALAETVAADLADKLESHLTVLEESAGPLEAGVMDDAERRSRLLSGLGPARALFDGIALVALDGTVLEHAPPIAMRGPASLIDRGYFKQVLNSGRGAISPPLQSRAGYGAAVMMAVPLRAADGQLAGVLVAALHLERSNMLGRLARATVGRTGHFEVVTGGEAPVFVVHPDRARLLGAAPRTVTTDDAARPDVVTRVPVRTVGWELRAVLPADEAFAPVARARERLWWILAGLATLCAAGTWVGMHFLLRPLTTLRVSMQALRENADADPAAIDSGASDERGELAREFVCLLGDLRARRAEIAAVADASPLGIFRSDARGYLTYVNDAYLQIHGVAREQSADGWLQLVDEAARPAAWQGWQVAVREPRPFHLVRHIVRPDGTPAVLKLRTAPLLVDGRLEGHVGTVADITQETAAENAMRLLAAIFEATTDYVVQADARGRITYMNAAARRICGIGVDEAIAHREFSDFNTPETNELYARVIVPAVKANGIWVGDTTVYNHERQPIPVSHMVLAHRDKSGCIEHYSAVMRDISAHVEDQRVLQRQAATLRSVTEAIPAMVAVVGSDGHYRFVNSAFERWCGAQRDSIIGRPLAEVVGRQEYQRSRPWIKRVMTGETVSFEKHYEERAGSRHLSISYIPLWLGDGAVDGFVEVAQDITQHRQETGRLLELAHRDILTGVLNRAGFETFLERCLEQDQGAELALLYIDLDHFKPVNDQHGHPVGDQVLQQFAQRVRNAVRPNDAVARLGGDEFAVVLLGVRDLASAHGVADKVVALARMPFDIDGLSLSIGASVGVAYRIKPGTGWRDFVATADELLYQAKRAGRGQHASVLH